jgi:hypothetical protein
MTDSLPELERRRSRTLAEIAALCDFRRGSISATTGRCGSSGCHCHKPGDPGHGPNLRLTCKVDGKTVTRAFPLPRHSAKPRKLDLALRCCQFNSRFESYREARRAA